MKPREPVFIRHSQTHATVAVSEARGALSLITHPYAACVSASDHRDSVGTQTLMQLKRSKHEVQPLISLLFFYPKRRQQCPQQKPAVAFSPEETDNETLHLPAHTHTHVVRIDTGKHQGNSSGNIKKEDIGRIFWFITWWYITTFTDID